MDVRHGLMTFALDESSADGSDVIGKGRVGRNLRVRSECYVVTT